MEFSGSINTDQFGGDLKSVDNDVQTCSGSIHSSDNNVGKFSGYHVFKDSSLGFISLLALDLTYSQTVFRFTR